MPKKIEKFEDNNLQKEKPRSQKTETGGDVHSIETRLVGLPSNETEVAETIDQEQVEVSELQPGEISFERAQEISNQEQAVLIESNDLPLEQKANLARETNSQSEKEGSDISELAAIFDANLKYLLRINSPLTNPEIPKQGTHFLLAKSESAAIKSALIKLGYNLAEIGNLGFQASKNSNDLIFIYAQEKNKKEKNN